MNGLQCLDESEKGEGDFIDFDVFEELVGEAEVAELEFVFDRGLLFIHELLGVAFSIYVACFNSLLFSLIFKFG